MKGLKAALLLLALPAAAENWEAAEPQERCALCHGYFGNDPRFKFPKLAAQRPDYIEAQIRAFLDGRRDNDGGQMVKTVTEITEDDIPVVVAWFATQDPPSVTRPEDPDLARQGQVVWTVSACAECHDADVAAKKNAPLLRAQHPAYLAKQIRDFREGRRHMNDRAKSEAISGLTAADIDALSIWLGATPRGAQ